MAPRIDLGTLIVAILMVLFTFNPQFISALQWLHRKARSLLTPKDVKCELLLWKDVTIGLLHSHARQGGPPRCSDCNSAKHHDHSERCWLTTIALVFNNSWFTDTRRKYTKKPPQLPLGERFLRTEARVVLAYFLCTAQISVFKDEMLGSSLKHVDLKEQDGLVVGHVGPAEKILDLTKEEVDCILQGWPPFYRKTFLSREGHMLESPLTTVDFVRRPGWIIAIGLGCVQPTDVFVDNSEERERSLFNFAIGRVKRVLEDQFELEWLGNNIISNAKESINKMLRGGQSIELEDASPNLDPASYSKLKNISRLTKAQCETLMRVFNNMLITAADKSSIDPVLAICMDRVITGVKVALKYSSTRRALRVPPLLQGDKIIYLRDCKREED